MNTNNSKKGIAILAMFLFISPSVILANSGVRVHAEEMRSALSAGDLNSVRALLEYGEKSQTIQSFNEMFVPFFMLMIEARPDEATELHSSINEKYGALIDLKDYNEHFSGMCVAFKNANEQPETSPLDLYIQPLPGPRDTLSLAEITILLSLGISKQIERSLESGGDLSAANTTENAIQSISEIPPAPALGIAKIDKDYPQAEPVIKESAEEPFEQSSNWWLWLIGVFVLLVGIGLVARRKS